MRLRATALVALALAAAGAAPPALARHTDKHCTATVHHPLGVDDVPLPVPVDPGVHDIGLVKVFVNCRR